MKSKKNADIFGKALDAMDAKSDNANPHDLPASLVQPVGQCPRCAELTRRVDTLAARVVELEDELMQVNDRCNSWRNSAGRAYQDLREAADNVQSWRNKAERYESQLELIRAQIACWESQVETGRAHPAELTDTEPE